MAGANANTKTLPIAGGLGAAALLALGAMVAHHEGYVPHTYADPVGVPTICYGHTGPDVTPGRTATQDECRELLSGDLAAAYAHVWRCLPVPMEPHVAKALTSAVYNVGQRLVCGQTTLRRKALQGDWAGACAELSRWVYAGGRVLPGLVKRRAAERALCEGREQ